MDRRAAGALLALAACIACSTAAPMASSNQTALDVYDGASEGCYYNFQHYGEGDRIMTNEPCLNCTCHNRMLMCYLRVCPFTKPIGQDCTVEKRADQCCPIVTCPDVPVDLLTSTSTSSPAEYGATGIGKQDKYGCSINGRYFPEGSKVPPSPNKPCEHCYCIRNMTTCVMQECTLHVDGCVPIYHKDVCCPVRYSCDHPEDEIPLLDDMTTTVRPTPGFLLTTTTLTPVTQASQDCVHDDQIFADGALIKTEKACEHCYCMKGDIVCVVQECGTPMENEGKNCTSLPPRDGQCCPDTYICEGDEPVTDQSPVLTTEAIVASTNPPRKGVEGSGYRKETDESYTDMPIFDTTEPEGSGEDQPTLSIVEPETLTPEKQTPDLEDEMFITTAKESEMKPHSSTAEPSLDETKVPISEASAEQSSPEYEHEIATESIKPDLDTEDETTLNKQDEVSPIEDLKITDEVKETHEPSLTTVTGDSYDVSSSSEALTSREDQSIITTEPSFRKEDFIPTVTDKARPAVLNEVATQGIYKESTTQDIYKEATTKGILTETEAVTQGSFNEVTTEVTSKDVTESGLHEHIFTVEEHKEPVTLSVDTTTHGAQTYVDEAIETTESSSKGDVALNEKEISNEYGSSTYKPELVETTTLNPIENEIEEDSHDSSGRIPGEGDCLLNGITYKNYSTVPSTNKCHTQCRCISSIVKCDPILCSPPPEYANMNKCQPIYDSAESCCPTYICDQSKDTVLPESHSQMSGTESTKPIYDSECKGEECKVIEDGEQIVSIPAESPLPDCGSEGCVANTGSSTAQTDECVNGKCDQPLNKEQPCDASTGCQVSAVTPCVGDDCTGHHHLDETVDKISSIEKECDNDSCRRKEISQVAQELSTPETENVLKELSTEAPFILEATTPAIEKDISATISPDYSITKPDQEQTSISQEQSFETSSEKIDSDLEEQKTKPEEYLSETTDASIIPGEPFTSKQPKDEIDVNEISTEHGPLVEISTIKEKEYLTTTSHSLLTEPTLAEENTETQKTEEEITLEEKKHTTEASILSSESHEITMPEADKITTQSVPLTSGPQEFTLQDNEKEMVKLDSSNENEPPLEEDKKYSGETSATESTVTKEKDLTTLSPSLIQDDNYVTDKHIINEEETTPNIMEEIVTKLEESNSVEENLTEDSIDNIYTTQRNLETTKLDTVSADTSSVDKTTEDSKVPSASSESTEGVATESSIVDSMEEKVTQQVSDESVAEQIKTYTTEAVPSDTEQYKTTQLPESEVPEDVLGTKESELEESITKAPETEDKHADEIAQTTQQDQMESLNGRGTESLTENVETESPTGIEHFPEVDMYYTTKSEGIEIGFDKTQTKLAESSTENTLDSSQKTIIDNMVTKLPTKDDDEVTKFDLDSKTLTTEPSRRAEAASEVSPAIDESEENIIPIDIKESTTILPSSDFHDKDKSTSEEKDTEISEPHISTESIPYVDIVTEHIIDSHTLSTHDLHIVEKDEEHTTPKLVDTASEGHEIELSTSKIYPNIEGVTEDTYTEGLSDVTKQTEEGKTSESDVMTQHDLSLSRTTLLPETSENILQTSAITQPQGSETGSYGIDHTTEIAKSEENITPKLDITTAVEEISETDDKKESTVATPLLDESYPHDITSEASLFPEKDIIEKTTSVPQTITEKELASGYPDQESSQGIEMEDIKPTTEIPEMQTSKTSEAQQFTVDHSITTDVHEDEEDLEKLHKPTTEITEIFPEKDITNTQLKDKSSEIADIITSSSPMDVTETMTDVQETPKMTYRPVLGTSEDTTTEKAELAIIPDDHVNVDENTVKIIDMTPTEEYMTDLTESPEGMVTKLDEKGEPVIKLTTEKAEEDHKQTHDEELITESPVFSVKITSDAESNDLVTKDLIGDMGDSTTPGLVTESPKIPTEVNDFEEESKFTILPAGHEQVSLEDKDELSEPSVHQVTDIPTTSSLESVTEALPEFIDVKDHEKTVTDEKEQMEDLFTAKPEVVTEIIEETIDDNRKSTDLSQVTDTPTSKVTETLEEVTKSLDQETQEESTAKPLLESTLVDKVADKEPTTSSEIFVPVETTSQLPEDDSIKKDATFITEKDTESFTEISEHSPDTPSETEDKNLVTDIYEVSPTSTSHDGLAGDDVSVNTESVVTAPVDETHESDLIGDLDKTVTEVPISSIKPNEEDLLKDSSPKVEGVQEGVTQASFDSAMSSETNQKDESITEKEQFDSHTVSKDEDKVTSSYMDEHLTHLPEEVLTDLHKPSTEASESLTNDDIAKTEISMTPTLHTNEEKVLTDVPHSFTTQKPETETETSPTLSTETHSSVPEVIHVIDDQIKETEVPELHTEPPASISHVAQKDTTIKEILSTESTVVNDDYSGVTHKIYDDSTSQPKEPSYITTERVEIPAQLDLEGSTEVSKEPSRLDTKPVDETSEYETSSQTSELSESTPYLVELEEHTHSIEQVTPEVHQEEEPSTMTSEENADKEEYDVTTESKIVHDQEYQTAEIPKETESTVEEVKRVSTTASSQDDLNTFHTTELSQEKSTEHLAEYEKHTTPQAAYTESEAEVTEHVSASHDEGTSTIASLDTTLTYEKQEEPKQEEQAVAVTETEKEIAGATDKPVEPISPVREITAPEEEFIPAVTKGTTKLAEDITTLAPTHLDKFTTPQDKPTEIVSSTSPQELPKPGFSDVLPTDDIPSTDSESHFPPTGSSGYGQEPDYGEEEQTLEPGTCRYGGKTYLSAQQIPRDDPCDFCFCFRSDIICLQQSCPPPIHGCHEEPIQGFCCPRYECPVSMATTLNITTTTTTTTTTLPPHFLPHAYKGAAQRRGCQIKGHSYKVGEVVRASSGPCLHCTCGGDGQMKCDPKACTPEPMLRHMIAAAVSAKRRR